MQPFHKGVGLWDLAKDIPTGYTITGTPCHSFMHRDHVEGVMSEIYVFVVQDFAGSPCIPQGLMGCGWFIYGQIQALNHPSYVDGILHYVMKGSIT
jgi:hypothetical protein